MFPVYTGDDSPNTCSGTSMQKQQTTKQPYNSCIPPLPWFPSLSISPSTPFFRVSLSPSLLSLSSLRSAPLNWLIEPQIDSPFRLGKVITMASYCYLSKPTRRKTQLTKRTDFRSLLHLPRCSRFQKIASVHRFFAAADNKMQADKKLSTKNPKRAEVAYRSEKEGNTTKQQASERPQEAQFLTIGRLGAGSGSGKGESVGGLSPRSLLIQRK